MHWTRRLALSHMVAVPLANGRGSAGGDWRLRREARGAVATRGERDRAEGR